MDAERQKVSAYIGDGPAERNGSSEGMVWRVDLMWL
jgi:hypothetical protein